MPPDDQIWKPVPGTAERYLASDRGNVWDARRRKLLAASPHPRGYLSVHLSGRTHLAHVVVASAFFGAVPDGLQVNHKDGNKVNNVISNLELMTQTENLLHATDPNGPIRHDPGKHVRKLSEDQVAEIRRLRPTMGVVALAKMFGINKGTVVHIVKGTRRRLALRLSAPPQGV